MFGNSRPACAFSPKRDREISRQRDDREFKTKLLAASARPALSSSRKRLPATHSTSPAAFAAERVIVELRTKVQSAKSEAVVQRMQTDGDLVEALASLGYRHEEARAALGKVDETLHGVEERLKAALAILGKK